MNDSNHQLFENLIAQIEVVRTHAVELDLQLDADVQKTHRACRESAHNLTAYLALRNFDLRELQEQLSALGLSSLGRSEAHTLASLDAVLQVLHRLAGRDGIVTSHAEDFQRGQSLLAAHTEALLGPAPPERDTRIMVTMPSEAAQDYALVSELLRCGMDCARINCAHDQETTWSGIVANLQKARREVGRPCRILMDLGGPKLRTSPIAQPLTLCQGDQLALCRDPIVAEESATEAHAGSVAARIGCSLPQVFECVQPGQAVLLDDGKIEGVIRSVSKQEIQIEITHAKEKGSHLGGDKGINFPDSDLVLPGLTVEDLANLDFVVRHADIVGLSFASAPEDVLQLQAELKARDARLGILLKIETRRGFDQLPKLLLAAMRSYPVGVMIARGDLAVECGWERTAELQEEILWLCEAGHVPTVWATQVLDHLARKGWPSRAEITDAAMSQRAECVMLNKGPYILEAVRMLDDILQRMQSHQNKKTAMLRSLKVSDLSHAVQSSE